MAMSTGVKFNGYDVADWSREIARLKRAGQDEEALDLALGCLRALAGNGPTSLRFVTQVTVLQHRLGLLDDEIAVLEHFRSPGRLRGGQRDLLDVEKRLAKSRELRAKATGEDPTPFRAQWRRLVDAHKSAPAPAQPFLPTPERLAVAEFVAVDFETANRRGAVSACQIALTRVRDGELAEEYVTYLRPPAGYQRFEFTDLHGISWPDVADAPTWSQVGADIAEFVGDRPVWAHNAGFDSGVWRGLDDHFGLRTHPAEFYCTVRLSRKSAPGLVNHRLPTVTEHYAPGFVLDHHRADSDARACALIVAAMQRDPAVATLLAD